MAYLFTIYSVTEPKVLRERELKVLETVCDIMDLLVSFYDEIKELGHLGHASQKLYYMSQLMNYGLTIIKNITI